MSTSILDLFRNFGYKHPGTWSGRVVSDAGARVSERMRHDRRVTQHPPATSVMLKLSGYRAVIEPDRWIPGSFTLVVDGTRQSHVNIEDPRVVFFEYITIFFRAVLATHDRSGQ